MIPTGSGIPSWTPTDIYLSADEIRQLPPVRHGGGQVCMWCGSPPGPPTYRLEGAHVARKQMGGRKKDGPQYELCRSCHQGPEGIDSVSHKGLAIRRDTLLGVGIELVDGVVVERQLVRW